MKKTLFAGIILSALLMLSSSNSLFCQDILSSVINGKIDEVKALLAKGVSPNTKPGKESILAMSPTSTFPEMTKLLINAKGIKLNEWNIESMPELSWKYQVLMKNIEFPEIVKLLIDKGAMLDLQDDKIMWDGKLHESGGYTALMFAVGAPNFTYTESAKLLIDKGAKIDIQNKMGYTALMLGVHNTEISKILIDKGAKLDLQSKGGETALMLAAGKYTDVVKMLIDKGANILIRQSTYKVSPNAMDYAAMKGNIEAAKLLMARAVSLGVKSEMIYSALHWAVISNQLEMAKYLLDEGANIEGNDDLGGYTPLMETSMLEMVEMLVSRGANVNARNKFDYTPLHKAVSNYMVADPNEKNCDKILNLLIEKGAKIDAQDGNGNTPLIYSVQKIGPFKTLIAKGANINMQNKNGESVLMFAVKGGLLKVVLGIMPVVGGSVDAVKLLLSKGADIELQDKWGKTALMHAAGGVNALGNKYGTYTDILEMLVKKGAKLEVEDKEGHTALYWAKRYNRTKSVDLLLAKGANPAKSYDKAADKSNVTEGLVGIWEKYFKHEGVTYTTRVVLNKDWTYSKAMKTSTSQWVPDGPGYNSYELRDGRMWIFINNSFPAVIEYRLEGKDLVMNGEKYVKVVK
ncbi:MAG: ankyrin repeat domain-containing protein [Bacteroidales bacterium]|jgi:ankyrin repeat protein